MAVLVADAVLRLWGAGVTSSSPLYCHDSWVWRGRWDNKGNMKIWKENIVHSHALRLHWNDAKEQSVYHEAVSQVGISWWRWRRHICLQYWRWKMYWTGYPQSLHKYRGVNASGIHTARFETWENLWRSFFISYFDALLNTDLNRTPPLACAGAAYCHECYCCPHQSHRIHIANLPQRLITKRQCDIVWKASFPFLIQWYVHPGCHGNSV